MPHEPQEDLIDNLAACANGEARAFERLYRATSPHLYAQLLRIVREEGAAQDCLQQVYLRVWQTAGRYDANLARPMTWLSTIARNIGIDWLRRRYRHVEDGDEALDRLGSDPDMAAISELAQQTRRLHVCLEELSPDQRRVLEKAYFEGLTHGELAGALSQPLGTVKSWIRRGLERLKACMSRGI
ncbi:MULTISPECIES: sigma-70 family RNA polymerase sigma factor [Modicisalibacter]|uniref:sigma-70 family RNA polymerase sigma factor n=1 Tax=Modicisalibacter TaxID=574347 RepID=UPI00100BC802|nr:MULTISPECIES: sigma-70 family RNA polymerase sigma factor [Halomonadaceae]MBZ9556733.1 sigma-70 family RNA polymerase sigma factor [Modicisalibacter sp. R2A 31.J]MBZ9574798.1 sigma-70 family RNA polymerase sigma factor [Modicisalibacter sp. MOD 31.J]